MLAVNFVPFVVTTVRKENNGGIKDELANYSSISFLFCISEENGEETGIILCGPPRFLR
jgi:hypothetical protein